MGIKNLQSNEINQNGYHKNILTQDKIGALFIFPNGYIPNDCLACDGYVLKILDYSKLYKIIGKDYNKGDEEAEEFRIPDYNITGNFLQPGSNNFGTIKAAGLPNITGAFLPRGDSGCYPFFDYSTASGAFSKSSAGGSTPPYENAGGSSGAKVGAFNFSAKNSNAIYGKSTTVQPPSQIVHICIKYK